MGLKWILHNPGMFCGLAILFLLILTAVVGPAVAPFPEHHQDLDHRLERPSGRHLLGTDELGRDILSRLIMGSRISLKVGFSVVFFSLAVGLIVGSVAGYFGGFVEEVIMRLVDILLAFPGILLAIALVSVLGPNLNNVILALSLIGWVGYARLVRGQILKLREMDFVQAARSSGAGPVRIILRHYTPNLTAPLLVQATLGMAGAIIAEAGLSFLGLGVQPPTSSWGSMLNNGADFITTAPYLTFFPGLAIMLVVLSLNFLGDGLRDLLDPKLQA